jgi:hypothetical protein
MHGPRGCWHLRLNISWLSSSEANQILPAQFKPTRGFQAFTGIAKLLRYRQLLNYLGLQTYFLDLKVSLIYIILLF